MKNIAVAGLLGVALLCGPGAARADRIAVTFYGTVSRIDDPSGGGTTAGVSQGAAFVATITYEENAAAFETFSDRQGVSFANYPYLFSSLRVGDLAFDSDGRTLAGYAPISVVNNRHPYFGGFDDLSFHGALDPATYAPDSRFNIRISDRTSSVVPSLNLPTNLDSGHLYLSHDTSARFEFVFKPAGDPAGFATVSGYITSFASVRIPTSQTPEPGSLALAVVAAGLLGVARRRRR